MKTTYPFKVTYRRRHPSAPYWINGGKPYYDKETSEMEFVSREKAEEYVARKKRAGTGGYFRIHEGQFEVEESYL